MHSRMLQDAVSSCNLSGVLFLFFVVVLSTATFCPVSWPHSVSDSEEYVGRRDWERAVDWYFQIFGCGCDRGPTPTLPARRVFEIEVIFNSLSLWNFIAWRQSKAELYVRRGRVRFLCLLYSVFRSKKFGVVVPHQKTTVPHRTMFNVTKSSWWNQKPSSFFVWSRLLLLLLQQAETTTIQ